MRRWMAATVAVAVVLMPAAWPSGGSGLYGQVRKGPVSPVCKTGVPCTAPVQATLVFTRPGRSYRFRSSAKGMYRAALAPGYYGVSMLHGAGIGKTIKPARVHVRAGHTDRIDFFVDTGIR